MSTSKSFRLTAGSSALLDLLRLLAALIVFFDHAFNQWFPVLSWELTQTVNMGHSAVIVFFVLSGYVISYSTSTNNRGPMQYAQARLSRLYSVVLPALLFTVCAEIVVNLVNPAVGSDYHRDLSWFRYILSACFLNEIWFFSASPPMNGPLWSLSFEFWYYVVFGLWFYKGKGWKASILPVLACMIAGPKILLMMPVWLAGMAASSLPKPQLPTTKAWFIVVLSLLTSFVLMIKLPAFPFQIDAHHFTYANQFLTDWVSGFFIGLALWFLPYTNGLPAKQAWLIKLRKVADLTFPIYLLHYPLLIVWKAFFGTAVGNAGQFWMATLMVLATTIGIGIFLERQRHAWSQFFTWVLLFVKMVVLKVVSHKLLPRWSNS